MVLLAGVFLRLFCFLGSVCGFFVYGDFSPGWPVERPMGAPALRGQRSLRRTGGASRHPVGACRERKTVSDRAPGKFFRFNSLLKRCISLLRRGAQGYSQKHSLSARQRNLIQTQNMRLNDFATLGRARGAGGNCAQAARAALTPGGRCLPARGITCSPKFSHPAGPVRVPSGTPSKTPNGCGRHPVKNIWKKI